VTRAVSLLRVLLIAVVAVGLLAAAHPLWLPLLARLMVRNDGPAHADIAVVLAGDYGGRRIVAAAELVKRGYVPAVLVSGPCIFYGVCESALEIPFAVRQGYPAEWFIPFPNSAHSTREEAASLLPELKRRNIHRFLLVTSDYHSARAGRTFAEAMRLQAPSMEMRVVAAKDPDFAPERWWRFREGQKTVFLEAWKNVASFLGI